MADAARSARGAFKDITSGASDMSDGVRGSATNTRAAIGLIDNTIRGDHMRAMADLIHEYSQTSIVMKALPFAATAGAIALAASVVVAAVIHFRELREEQEKLTAEQTKFGTSINGAFTSLDDKILTAAQRADELRNDHLGALAKELQLIDNQSLAELVHSFEIVSKAADAVFADLKSHWYTFGIGSAGASHALDQFQTQYQSLLSQGKDKEASDLLKGTRDSAQRILDMQKQAAGSRSGGGLIGPSVDYTAQYAALNELHKAGVGYTEKEVSAQQALVQALNAQMGVEARVSDLKKLDKGNATQSTAGEMSRQNAEAAKAAADSQLKMGELAIAADKATAESRLAISHASADERLTSELDFAKRQYDVQLAGNQQQIAALDKLGKDYPNQLKALQDKALELQQGYTTRVTELQSQAQTEQAAKTLRDMQESEREKIDATQQGSAARLAAIDEALREEAAHNLQAEDSYRSLLTQRVETIRQMAEQELQARIQGIEAASKADEQSIASQYRIGQMQLDARNATIGEQERLELEHANNLYGLELAGLNRELQALEQSGIAKLAEVEKTQQKIQQLTRAHENEVTEIQARADSQRAKEFSRAMVQMETSMVQSFFAMLSGHRSFASEMSGIAQSLTQNLITAAIQRMNHQESEKVSDAKTAAANVYSEVSGWPVVGPFLAPELAAAAFAGVMSFEKGGIVPGVGRGDIVPAMLEPGEGVVPGGVMDSLSRMARSGEMGHAGPHVTMHYRPTFHVQTIDKSGVRDMLDKHTDEFTKHFHNTVRKMNR